MLILNVNYTILTELYGKLQDEANFVNWASLFAAITWNKIGFARRIKGFKIYETSVTQELVFQFYLSSASRQVPIEIYESRNENANGNDLEIFIETSEGYISFPTQAKILNSKNQYSKINHESGGRYQIDSLIQYAERNGGVPLYLLYNHVFDENWNQFIKPDNWLDIELYGCSFAPARVLREKFYQEDKGQDGVVTWQKPSFQDLHPHFAVPFHTLFSEVLQKSINDWNVKLLIPEMKTIRWYTKDEITLEEDWKDLAPLPAIGKIPMEYEFVNSVRAIENLNNFSPKFRILITKEVRKSALYMLS